MYIWLQSWCFYDYTLQHFIKTWSCSIVKKQTKIRIFLEGPEPYVGHRIANGIKITLPASVLINMFSSVQSLSHVWLSATHRLQHARLPCPSPTPRAYSNSWPLVGDAIQPSHPLSFPYPPTFNLSQNQGLFQWVNSLHQVAKLLEFQVQHQSFQWIFRTDLL